MQSYKSAITKFGNKNYIDKHICFCIDKADVFIDAIFISNFGLIVVKFSLLIANFFAYYNKQRKSGVHDFSARPFRRGPFRRQYSVLFTNTNPKP